MPSQDGCLPSNTAASVTGVPVVGWHPTTRDGRHTKDCSPRGGLSIPPDHRSPTLITHRAEAPAMSTPVAELVLALLRAAAGLVVFGWVIWSTRRLYAAVTDLLANWDRWDTYPVPDKRAAWNLATLLWILAGWALLTAAIVAYLGWVLGLLP